MLGLFGIFGRSHELQRLDPFGPINLVYEYKDTLPSPQNSVDGDPFATVGTVTEDVMSRLVTAHWEEDKISFRLVEYGQLQAGTAARLTTNLGSEAERASGANANGEVRYRVSIAKCPARNELSDFSRL